jgi:protein-S-isoprenylcysteine O-methyltransferase Ste14
MYESTYFKIVIFIAVSGCLIWLSRRSLRNVRSHGFYRFFAWEAILALILLNSDNWFDDWLGFRQIISWALLSLSAYLVTHGALVLYRSGKPDKSRVNSTLIGIEKTTELVTTGIYRYIRHPIYGSAVIGVWGVVLKSVTAVSVFLALISIVFLTVTAKLEEYENLKYFGENYRHYMERTRMFIPYIL